MTTSDARLKQLLAQRQEARMLYNAACYALEQLAAKLDEATAKRAPFQRTLTGIRIQKLAASRNLEQRKERNQQARAALQAEIRSEVAMRRNLRTKAHQAWLDGDHLLARQRADAAKACSDIIRRIERKQQELHDNCDDLLEAYNIIRDDELEAMANLEREDVVVQRLEFEVTRAQTHVAEAREEKIRASRAYELRQRKVRRSQERFRASWPDIARAAGVPEKYVHNVEISFSPEGKMSIYFGENGPWGPGHAHYGFDVDGELEYAREIDQPHGPQNYVRPKASVLSA